MFENSWLKYIYPKSLWGQLVSLLLLALVISQLVVLLIFVDARRIANGNFIQDRMVDRIVSLVNSVEVNGSGIRPTRKMFKKFANPDLRFRVGFTPRRGRDDQLEYSTQIHELLTSRLPNVKKIIVTSEAMKSPLGVKFHGRRLPKMVHISVQLSKKLWLNIDHTEPPFSYAWILPLLLTMVLMMLFIIIIVSWVVRRMTKPLGALADAAQKLGRGQDVGELVEEGTADVRHVTQSFNQMNRKIKNFVDDRTKMLAAISHDLRTPITSLRLRAEFIEDKEMQGKILETLDEMQMMTEAALKFSKDSVSDEKTKETDLESLLESLVEDYEDMGAKVTLSEDVGRPQVVLPMRVMAMKRALRNLIDNGLKYGEQVEVDFKLVDGDKNVVICIADIGSGIAEDEFEKVFEPFYRLEKSRNKDTGGVGLGLSIARNIIRGHGGDVTIGNIMQDGDVKGLEVRVILSL
ncbi:MAG: two-component sensor histidine kinase [Hyphomicrobiales bacterium]|nr:MAG: two-component sensor histidine kinase [Hyphomicrobiales bacterium]